MGPMVLEERPTAAIEPHELARRIAEHEWYHTLELAPGVLTPGWFDTRKVLDVIPLPVSLNGLRCLDVGSFDGFWAFEMERRGAAEVVAIDILDPREWDWPVTSAPSVVEEIGKRKKRGEGFLLAREALGSRVERRELSVYDLDPADIGTFDFVYVGSLLLHLRDPVRALERVRAVCTGRALFVDAIDLELTLRNPRRPVATLDGHGRPWWWKPNLACLVRMVEAAGMRPVLPPRRFFMAHGAGQQAPRPAPRALLRREGRELAVQARWGDPHATILAEPVATPT